MDFTREPIIETVVTPKEGCKLVVRSSKAQGQEEYFVDSVEVISFGNSVFFRSQERPKAFMVPAADYEILEAREARMVLKNVGLDRSIKIGGGRESNIKQVKEPVLEKKPLPEVEAPKAPLEDEALSDSKSNGRKKDRRRQYRKRRGRSDDSQVEEKEEGEESDSALPASTSAPTPTAPISILAAPPLLISETIARYKDNALFKGAFYTKEEMALKVENGENQEKEVLPLEAPVSPEEFPATQEPFLKESDDIVPTTHFGEEQFPEKDYSTPHHE